MSYIMIALGWVLKLCNLLVGNYGVAIILFTVLIKLALLPLMVKQQRSMMMTQKLQPLLNELQQKYANDKEKLNAETMKLYQKYKVNPMSGCLPMLIQLPILMALYWVVKKPVVYLMGFGEDEVWRIVSAVLDWAEGNPGGLSQFFTALGIEKLETLTENSYRMFGMYEIQIAEFIHAHPEIMNSQFITETGKNYDIIDFNFIGLNLSMTPNMGAFFGLFLGRVNGLTAETMLLWTIPLLSGLSSWFTSKISQAMQPAQPQKNANGEEQPNPMKSMTLMMPLISAWFAFTLPSAVGLYWIVSNILQLAQQFVLTKVIRIDVTDEQIEGEIVNVKKNRKKRKK
ncbi:MAG: YidC/Oxa1 family membrane protein insertase [Clostridia bacterium]|nr:YidC/Oxa1 family membrane protein insertase [Clostridia bacterium]